MDQVSKLEIRADTRTLSYQALAGMKGNLRGPHKPSCTWDEAQKGALLQVRKEQPGKPDTQSSDTGRSPQEAASLHPQGSSKYQVRKDDLRNRWGVHNHRNPKGGHFHRPSMKKACQQVTGPSRG